MNKKNFLSETIEQILFEMDYSEALRVFQQYGNVDAGSLSKDELKKIYRNLSVKYHPDKNPQGGKIFTDINSAYEILGKGKPAGGGSGDASYDEARKKRDDLRQQFDNLRKKYANDFKSYSREDIYDRMRQEREGRSSSQQGAEFSEPSFSPSTASKIKKFFGLSPYSREDKEAYNDFKKQIKAEEQAWIKTYRSGNWNAVLQQRYDDWKRNTAIAEKKYADYFKQKYG